MMMLMLSPPRDLTELVLILVKIFVFITIKIMSPQLHFAQLLLFLVPWNAIINSYYCKAPPTFCTFFNVACLEVEIQVGWVKCVVGRERCRQFERVYFNNHNKNGERIMNSRTDARSKTDIWILFLHSVKNPLEELSNCWNPLIGLRKDSVQGAPSSLMIRKTRYYSENRCSIPQTRNKYFSSSINLNYGTCFDGTAFFIELPLSF